MQWFRAGVYRYRRRVVLDPILRSAFTIAGPVSIVAAAVALAFAFAGGRRTKSR